MNKYLIAFIIFSISALLAPAEDKPQGAADAAGNGDAKAGLVIVTAIYRSVGTHRSVDVTRSLRKALKVGAATIKLTTAYLAGGVDPAKRMPKETLIIYTINGEQKQKIFPEGEVLHFKEDLN